MKEKFIEKGFTRESLERIELLNGILAEYERQGYDLTLRQLYYQMVARGHIENTQKSYKRIGDLVSNARLAGLIDWNMITDRARETIYPAHWIDPAHILDNAARGFRIDKWDDQPVHVEVMVEKQALEGILIPVCQELDVRFTANKGYSSSSMMYGIGKRLSRAIQFGKKIVVFYLGDHDPSGMDMTRDIAERLEMFSGGYTIQVERLALNWDQIQRWVPPENPAKETDARFDDYANRYGTSSWELDAVEPATLANLVRGAIAQVMDDDLWEEALNKENEMRQSLHRYARDYRTKNGNQ